MRSRRQEQPDRSRKVVHHQVKTIMKRLSRVDGAQFWRGRNQQTDDSDAQRQHNAVLESHGHGQILAHFVLIGKMKEQQKGNPLLKQQEFRRGSINLDLMLATVFVSLWSFDLLGVEQTLLVLGEANAFSDLQSGTVEITNAQHDRAVPFQE
jgi:hypothetical protein